MQDTLFFLVLGVVAFAGFWFFIRPETKGYVQYLLLNDVVDAAQRNDFAKATTILSSITNRAKLSGLKTEPDGNLIPLHIKEKGDGSRVVELSSQGIADSSWGSSEIAWRELHGIKFETARIGKGEQLRATLQLTSGATRTLILTGMDTAEYLFFIRLATYALKYWKPEMPKV
jgi:hypothetical protein